MDVATLTEARKRMILGDIVICKSVLRSIADFGYNDVSPVLNTGVYICT
jgi:hypothetical protein